MSNFVTKVLKICGNNVYMKPIYTRNEFVSHYEYGPLGELLRQNIYKEWVHNNVICRDENVFQFSTANNDSENFIDGIKEQYTQIKSFCNDCLPFAIAYSSGSNSRGKIDSIEVTETKYFRPRTMTPLRYVAFTNPEEDRRFFHFWQRQRKVWWRKFSANPARFSLTEIHNKDNFEFVEIQAEFPWGIEPVEIVRLFPGNVFECLAEEEQELCKIKIGKKKIFPYIIESVTNLETAALCFLCDAFTEETRLDTEVHRQVMKFHRKLAPYKITFVIDSKKIEDENKKELLLLAEYMALNLKKEGISTLTVTQDYKKSVENHYEYFDLLGILYVAVLQESSLSDGLFELRSRETTLHVKYSSRKSPISTILEQ